MYFSGCVKFTLVVIERQVVSVLLQRAPSPVQVVVLRAVLAHFLAVVNALAIRAFILFHSTHTVKMSKNDCFCS